MCVRSAGACVRVCMCLQCAIQRILSGNLPKIFAIKLTAVCDLPPLLSWSHIVRFLCNSMKLWPVFWNVHSEKTFQEKRRFSKVGYVKLRSFATPFLRDSVHFQNYLYDPAKGSMRDVWCTAKCATTTANVSS